MSSVYTQDMFSQEQQTALLIMHRCCRHSGMDPNEQLLSIIDRFGFRNRENLEISGLNIVFSKMKNYILQNPSQIGFILFGLTENDKHLSEYITEKGECINISTHSIANTLFREYFKIDEINELCKSIPLYSDYCNHI